MSSPLIAKDFTFTFIFPNGKTDTICLRRPVAVYKEGNTVTLSGQGHKVLYAAVPYEDHQTVLLDMGREPGFKLEHDLRNWDYHPGPRSPSLSKELLEAVQEIQEWIHAQENK